MNDDFEMQLRAALRPQAPSQSFATRVMAQIEHRGSSRRGPLAWWIGAGLAASLVVAIGLQHRAAQQQELDSGLRARRQVIEALQVTNQKLNLALRVVSEGASS